VTPVTYFPARGRLFGKMTISTRRPAARIRHATAPRTHGPIDSAQWMPSQTQSAETRGNEELPLEEGDGRTGPAGRSQ